MLFLLNLILKIKSYLRLTRFLNNKYTLDARVQNILVWFIVLIVGLIVLQFFLTIIKYEETLNTKLLVKKENNLKLLNKLSSLDNKDPIDFLFNLMQQDKVYVNYNNHLYQNLIPDANISNAGGRMNIYVKQANKTVTIEHVTQLNEFYYP